jgi:SH3 domain protein
MHKIILIALSIICLLLWAWTEAAASETTQSRSQATRATTMFVSDELTIMLRSGPGNKYKILRALTSGTKLKVFESDNKFVHVHTLTGLDGWVLSQHLTNKPIAKQQLSEANEKISRLESTNSQLQEQLDQLKENYRKVKDENQDLDKAKSELDEELTHVRQIAAQPLRLSKEKKQLTLQTETLQTQVDNLKTELVSLRDNTQKQWFLTGAAVILLGILIGLMLPKLRRQRRSDWR